MLYKKYFDPPLVQSSIDNPAEARFSGGDRRDGKIYVYTEKIILAVNVAIATMRPLLIRGPSGSGKSSLAHSVARHLGWRYYEEVISSRTQARDLLWRFDSLRRLNDAQAHQLRENPAFYIEPGVLWWAIDRESAWKRGSTLIPKEDEAIEPSDAKDHERAIVLLDEIDKADPDVPNDLLVPLGSGQFIVQETRTKVKALHPPIVFITTNEERALSGAFLRRCVMLVLEPPDKEHLIQIAEAHFGPAHKKLYENIARHMIKLRSSTGQTHRLDVPDAAEYLDTVRVCLQLDITPSSKNKTWEAISNATIIKPRDASGGGYE